MELNNLGEMYDNFSELVIEKPVDSAILEDVGELLHKKYNLNYTHFYSENGLLQVIDNEEIMPEVVDMADKKTEIPFHCCMCKDLLGIAKLNWLSNELFLPVCTKCFDKHKVMPIGSITLFLKDLLETHCENILNYTDKLKVFLVI